MRPRQNWKFFPSLVLSLLALFLSLSIIPSTYSLGPGSSVTVNSTGDGDDGICDATNCTLREAIHAVVNDPSKSAINFSLPGDYPVISLTTSLPPLETPMNIGLILGTSQKIVLNGAGIGGIGFQVTNGNITIKNFVIQNFDIGIQVEGNGHLRLGSSFIGTNELGNASAPNRIGVALFTSNNSIGKSFLSGTQITSGNVISGNLEHGILFQGSGVSNNLILENLIGTNANGTAGLGNGGDGIRLIQAQNNWLGGATPGSANIISSNGGSGIALVNGSSSNTIQGNFIGTDQNGNQDLGNGEDGIALIGSPHNLIGGSDPGAANIISGNTHNGILLQEGGSNDNLVQGNLIGTNSSGNQSLPNEKNGIEILFGSSNFIGGTEQNEGNLVSGNKMDGILLRGAGADNNQIKGNKIGITANGSQSLGNQGNGIHLLTIVNDPEITDEDQGPSINTIGGPVIGAKNIISGNQGAGIRLEGKAISQNYIGGNFIGTNPEGNLAIGNGMEGIHLTEGIQADKLPKKPGPPVNNIIGGMEGFAPEGPCTGDCNLISGNGADGIRIGGSEVQGNKIWGNFIGTDQTGAQTIPNQGNGVQIAGGHHNFIGGYPETAEGPNKKRNVISGNTAFGIVIFGGTAKGNKIFGNLIGTDTTGTNALGNQGGILMQFNNGNQIGDSVPFSGNLISGNAGAGITIDDAHNIMVQGNRIGLKNDGLSALGNQGPGVLFSNASTADLIGGELADQGNHIAFNTGEGVQISGLRNIEVTGNSIHDNGAMGIDLGAPGLNPNDEGDVDDGVNDLQNSPVLSSVIPLELELEIQGTLSGLPNRPYRIHFYSNEVCDDSESGEGKFYLGLGLVTTNDQGIGDFSITVPKLGGEMITATATDDSRNTSEFSTCRKIGTGQGVDFDLDGVLDITDNCPRDNNPDQIDEDADGEGDPCDLCPGFDDSKDVDFDGTPDCLQILLHGAGSGCALQSTFYYSPESFGPIWLISIALALLTGWRRFHSKMIFNARGHRIAHNKKMIKTTRPLILIQSGLGTMSGRSHERPNKEPLWT